LKALWSLWVAIPGGAGNQTEPDSYGGEMGNDDHDSRLAPSPGPGEHLADETELWRRFVRDRDPAIREELVNRNLAFAKRLARRYRGASESFDDLLQVASLRW